MTDTLYKIAPLKWVKGLCNHVNEHYSASTPFGTFCIQRHRMDFEYSKPWEPWKMTYCFDEYYDEESFEVESIKAGEAKAAEIWEERLGRALIRHD